MLVELPLCAAGTPGKSLGLSVGNLLCYTCTLQWPQGVLPDFSVWSSSLVCCSIPRGDPRGDPRDLDRGYRSRRPPSPRGRRPPSPGRGYRGMRPPSPPRSYRSARSAVLRPAVFASGQ